MDQKLIAKKQDFAGLFMVTLATLMYEILLTRIFSVTMWYHFAFMAISIALFGMTVGAIIVYLFPLFFSEEKVRLQLSLSSLIFALFIVLSFLIHLNIPNMGFTGFTEDISKRGLLFLSINYIVISIPFIFSGISVCLALTRFPSQVSKLYAADLAGAAVGCILLIYVLNITDGPTAVIIVAFLACCGAVFFAYEESLRLLMRTSLIVAVLFACFAMVNTFLLDKQRPLIKLKWVKGQIEKQPLYDKWNSFSRITVKGNPQEPIVPSGWGLSPLYPSNHKVRQLKIQIDSSAGTVLTKFDGNLNELEHLKYDITNIVHYIKQNAKILIIGTGGGRDILSALAFKQKTIVGVEINKNIIEIANNKFGDFTGHLNRYPNVSFINDEARSYISRQKETFDIIQASLIDTWAATASGAFVLTENSLYTVEAWELFLEHLSSDGILTFSRWYYKERPGEMYRLVSLATEALDQSAVKNPRDHIIILSVMRGPGIGVGSGPGIGVGTILVSKKPFSSTDVDIIEAIAGKMGFDIVLSPRFSLDSTFSTIASGKNLAKFLETFPLNISAPTDDSPFFFNMLRLRDIFNSELRDEEVVSSNLKAVFILGVLIITVIGLTLLCIIVPLILTSKKVIMKGSLPFFIYFASIGFGFILIEISQMQRLIVFLGHPTYSLSVVLFSLLLSSGFGSYSTQKIADSYKSKPGIEVVLLLILLGVLIIVGVVTPVAMKEFQGSTTELRICLAAGILSLLGFFMGMTFPLGMKMAAVKSAQLTPWLWGINGATSVCASVIAVAIALSSGISASFWVGFLCYVIAFCALIWLSKKNENNLSRN